MKERDGQLFTILILLLIFLWSIWAFGAEKEITAKVYPRFSFSPATISIEAKFKPSAKNEYLIFVLRDEAGKVQQPYAAEYRSDERPLWDEQAMKFPSDNFLASSRDNLDAADGAFTKRWQGLRSGEYVIEVQLHRGKDVFTTRSSFRVIPGSGER